MSASTKIAGYTNLGAVTGLLVEGHDTVDYIGLTVDCGHGDPDWPKKQTLPNTGFQLKTSTGGTVEPLLRENAVKITRHYHGPNQSFVDVEPQDLPKAMAILGFDEDAIAKVQAMQRDAASRRAAYETNLTPKDVRNLMNLDARCERQLIKNEIQRISGNQSAVTR